MTLRPRNLTGNFLFVLTALAGLSCIMQSDSTETEPNNTFEQATSVTLDVTGAAHLTGTISSPNEVDIFSLGPMSAGDQVVIDVGTTGNLDADAGLFDELQRITFENDDRNLDLNQLDPFINAVIRHGSSVYYLVIQAAPLGSSNMMTGPYDVNIQVVRGGEVPPTSGQIVVLDFGGGTITIPGDQTYMVGPFDAADIAPVYAGTTAAVRQQVLSTVLADYAGLNMDIRVRPGDPMPAEGTYSDVLFGGQNTAAFGISQDVDPYNQIHNDGSIIFTDVFDPATFGRVLSTAELGTAIGNVATHEIGHLLGLNHVDNVFDLMDTTGGPNTLLFDQIFTTSPLDRSIFFVGQQDGDLLLNETVGAVP